MKPTREQRIEALKTELANLKRELKSTPNKYKQWTLAQEIKVVCKELEYLLYEF